ncbi:MAG: hypothetical protein FJ222_09080 [Lentisphaerae bacterium]|nr:hypothetical protein [Lentisphaerota bacterium]
MKTSSRSTLILFTVGTGTAGKHSNLAQGLVNSIRACPLQSTVGLIPSVSPDSKGIADLVIEELRIDRPDVHVSILASFSDPDDLLACRREFRALLQTLRQTVPCADLTVNPTSGTKQMTAAATLACLDVGMGQIAFITGERADGVVKTGTEQVNRVDAARLQAEQRLQDVLVLLEHGDYAAAERLASLSTSFFPFAAAAAAMLAKWNRLAYTEALKAASDFEVLAESRRVLDRLRAAPDYSVDRAADVLALAFREHTYGRPEEALSAIYRAVELLAKVRLSELECAPDCWYAENLIARLKPEERLKNELIRMQKECPDRPLALGLDKGLRLLEKDRFAFNTISCEDRDILRQRNETRFGHGGKCVSPEAVKRLYISVCDKSCDQWPEMKALLHASVFPDFAPHIRKELNHE